MGEKDIEYYCSVSSFSTREKQKGMGGSIASLVGLDDAVQKLSNIGTSFVNTSRQAGFDILDRLNDILSDNREKIVNDIKQNALQIVSETADKVKKDAKEVIEHTGETLSATAKFTIELAKNATSTMVNETLEKLRYEIEMVADDFITNQMVIAIGIFLFSILLLIFCYLFVHIHTTLGCCVQSIKLIIKIILMLVYPLLCMFYGLTLEWLVKIAMKKKNPFSIIGILIILTPGFYLILYVTCCKQVKSAMKHACETVIKWWTASKSKHKDLMLPGNVNTASMTVIQIPDRH
jgi:vacuolar-type H+-ATPase subunit H